MPQNEKGSEEEILVSLCGSNKAFRWNAIWSFNNLMLSVISRFILPLHHIKCSNAILKLYDWRAPSVKIIKILNFSFKLCNFFINSSWYSFKFQLHKFSRKILNMKYDIAFWFKNNETEDLTMLLSTLTTRHYVF